MAVKPKLLSNTTFYTTVRVQEKKVSLYFDILLFLSIHSFKQKIQFQEKNHILLNACFVI